jgi:apolipoprotein N-acyltransferase
VCANLAVAEPLVARLERRAVRRRMMLALSAVPMVGAGYGLLRLRSVEAMLAAAPKAQVGVVQGNMSLLGKRRQPGEGLRRHLEATRALQRAGPLDLVVWSETSVTRPLHEDQAFARYREQFGRSLGVPAIFGGVLVREVPDARRYVLFNAALVLDAAGEVRGRYDKQYLLAFGEFLPFGDVFPILYQWSPHSGRFTPGSALDPLPLGDRKIATIICYEDIIPSFVGKMMRHQPAQLLVNITNDAWFGDSTEPWIHLALAKYRAVEHRRFLVRSTNSGVSAIVDPAGRVTAHTGTFRQEAIRGEIAWLDGKTPYQLWGDAPWWLAAVASFAGAFLRRRREYPLAPPRPRSRPGTGGLGQGRVPP